MALDLFQPGAYARAAGGNLERPDIQKPVVSWMAWSINSDNGGGGSVAVWDKCRALWKANGIFDFPWMHCRSIADVEHLIAVGESEVSPAIGLNIEDVVSDKLSLQEVAGIVLDFWVNKYQNPVHMPTLAWVQNGQGWQWMNFAVAALEIFPDENESSKHVQDCIDHAFAEGLTKVTLMLKTKPPNSPATYGTFFSICHSLYTADDIAPIPSAWLEWKATEPCIRPSVPAEWYTKPYPKGQPVGPAKLPRALYPPDAAPGRNPSVDGPDILAWKRALKRGQRWALNKPFSSLDDTYYNAFSHGASPNVRDSGVAGFQRQEGLEDSGWVGDKTYQAARCSLIPIGPNTGKSLFDVEAVKLLNQAAKMDWTVPALIEPVQGFDSLDESLWQAYSIGRNMGLSDLGTYNPASTLPSGEPSDHAVYPAFAFDLGFDPDTGYANPTARAFFDRMIGRQEIEYVILGNMIWSKTNGLNAWTGGGHDNHCHVSGVR